MTEGQENAGLESSGPRVGHASRSWGPTHHTGISTMVPAPLTSLGFIHKVGKADKILRARTFNH